MMSEQERYDVSIKIISLLLIVKTQITLDYNMLIYPLSHCWDIVHNDFLKKKIFKLQNDTC